MIVINKGESNDIYVTVSDFASSSNDEYVLSATHTVSNKTTDISMRRVNNTLRYDKFTINEASHSLAKGKYDYVIKNNSGSIAEYGKMEVIGAEASQSVYNKQDNTQKFYERN